MPERLSAAGVSWKVYNDPTALLELSPFPYFKVYSEPSIAGGGGVGVAGLVADVSRRPSKPTSRPARFRGLLDHATSGSV